MDSTDANAAYMKTLADTNKLLMSPSEWVDHLRHSQHEYHSWIIWTPIEESLVFWKCIFPAAKHMAKDLQIIILDQNSHNFTVNPEKQFAIVGLDAEILTHDYLKKLIRGEGQLSSILISQNFESLFYLHGVHRCKEKIHDMVRLLVDRDYNKQESPHTNLIISGIYGHSNIAMAVTPGVASRCNVCAVQ